MRGNSQNQNQKLEIHLELVRGMIARLNTVSKYFNKKLYLRFSFKDVWLMARIYALTASSKNVVAKEYKMMNVIL